MNRLIEYLMLLRLSLRLQLGRRFWVIPLLALAWPTYQAIGLLLGWRSQSFNEEDVQNALIGFPLVILAIGLGVRIIAVEIEQRTLEVTYTVPGGAYRVWVSKLVSALLPLLLAETLLAIVTVALFTEYPLTALYGAFQGAVFYLVMSMGLGALFKSEITAALVASVVLGLNGFLTGFGDLPNRWSPLFNPLGVGNTNTAEVLAWTIQNRIGVALAIGALTMLACARAERREQLLRV